MNDQEKIKIIIREVCLFFSLTENDLKTRCRDRELVEARNFIFYFARIYTNLSFKAIGILFYRDHASVLHACNLVEDLIKFNKYGPITERIDLILREKIGYQDIEKWVLSMGTL